MKSLFKYLYNNFVTFCVWAIRTVSLIGILLFMVMSAVFVYKGQFDYSIMCMLNVLLCLLINLKS